MANKLKIYACNGIGDAQQTGYTYWTDNTQTIDNTQAVNALLARINFLYTEVTHVRGLSNEQKIADLNELDLICVALDAAKRFREDGKKLYHAGEVIAVMLKDGAFKYSSLDDAERDAHLDELIDRFNEMMHEDGLKAENPEFMSWWKETVCERNKVGLNAEERKVTKSVLSEAVKGLGEIDESWKDNKDISEYLTKAGTYFLYLFFTDEQLRVLPDKFAKKRKYQQRIYNYCKAYFVGIYGSEEDMQDVICTGIMRDFGATPEDVCASIAKGEKVGEVVVSAVIGIAELIQIITIVAAALVAIVAAICDCVYKSNVKKYAAMSQSIIDGGTPDAEDLEGLDDGLISQNTKKYLPWILGGLAAVLILRN